LEVVVGKIYWQAHRGGAHEAPQNTIAAALYGWSLGAIVEVDVRTTADGEIITLHNSTLRETSNAPAEIADTDVSLLTYAEIAEYDVNRGFEERYPGEKTPRLSDLFDLALQAPGRELYLDLKDVDLDELAGLVKKHGVAERCVFCHCDAENCREIKRRVDMRCMLWIGGTAEDIMNKFRDALENDLDALDQIQLHLNQSGASTAEDWSYDLSPDFLLEALRETERLGIDLELFPWKMNERDILRMLGMGFTWFCTDYPAEFKKILNKWENGGGKECF
jgi:glycerophosphoryl diester phosphodiesterase